MTTLSSDVSSSSFFLLMYIYALDAKPLPRYSSFSMRCHTSVSRLHDEKGLRDEHLVMRMSVMIRPLWCWGIYPCMEVGSTRKFRSRKKTTIKAKKAEAVTWTMVRTWMGTAG